MYDLIYQELTTFSRNDFFLNYINSFLAVLIIILLFVFIFNFVKNLGGGY